MKINGSEHPTEGLSITQLAEVLQTSSPQHDGLGLAVVFTPDEELRLERDFPNGIGEGLRSALITAIKMTGNTPAFEYTYSGRVFRTRAGV